MTGPIGLSAGGKVDKSQQMIKAELQLYNPPTSTGGALGSKREVLTFQFNPKEVSIQKSAKWNREPTRGSQTAGPPQYHGPEPCKMTLEMFFDERTKQGTSVLDAVEKLFSCCVPTDETTQNKKGMPPIVVLHWGQVASFPGFITSVSAKYTLFTADGVPIRATCSVSVEELPAPWPPQNPTSGSYSVRRSHRVRGGDTLASIAYAEYGDPGMWRQLAAFNGIDDPLRCRPGTLVLVPGPEDLG